MSSLVERLSLKVLARIGYDAQRSPLPELQLTPELTVDFGQHDFESNSPLNLPPPPVKPPIRRPVGRRLPPELIHAIIDAGIEPTDALYHIDERRAKVRNRDFLVACTLVDVVWNAHATPLLYASLILDSRADDEGCFLDQPKSRSGMAPEADRRRALIQLLQERPDLAALVREVDFPSGQIEQFAAPFWSLIRTVRFSDASVTDLGSLALGYARKVVLPTSFALQRLAFTSFAQRPAKLADWVNLTNLARLDIMTSGDSYWLMDAFEDASLPNLIDLRIVTIQQSNDWSHAEAVLAIFGKQLQRFHFFDLSGRRPSMNIIMIRCPNLRELALNSHLIPLFGPGHEPPAVWALDRLLYGPPWVKPAGRPALEPSNRKDVSAAVAYYRPRRLALASLDGNMLTDVDREYARHLLNNLRIETGNTDLILEDRFGRTIVAD